MASKMIFRILNRPSDCSNMSSFDEKSETESSFASFYFEKMGSTGEDEADIEIEKTECSYYPDQKIDESSSCLVRPVFTEYEKEKKFLGTITDVDDTNRTFSAELIGSDDLITRNAIFSIDDLSPENVSLVEVGRRIIYIYGKQYRNGTVSNVSELYFRRNSSWTEREIEAKKSEAEELFAMLN